MPGEPHGISGTARLLLIAALLVVISWCSRAVLTQETLKTQGAVKGKITLVGESNENSTPEGILLELKPLLDGSPSLTAVTDAAGNYEFKGVRPGDYLLRLQAAGFEPFSAMLRIPGGATIVQNISAR